jgi:glycosyltransferase involved in cell wall biosynthesis
MCRPSWVGVLGHPAYRITNLWNKLQMRYWNWLEARQRRKWSGLPWGWFIGAHHTWKRVLQSISKTYEPDFFLVEHGRSAELIRYVKNLWPKAICIVNSHNVESELFRQILPDSGRKYLDISKIEQYERRVLSQSDLLWACSQDDLDKYRDLGVRPRNTGLVPNGVDTTHVGFIQSPPMGKTILFVGNLSYKPNVDGVLWFFKEVWPVIQRRVPDVQWQLVGSWPEPEILRLAGNGINVAANAPSLRPFLESSAVAICPLLSGSGTRLKILEAFSAGVPMVSTRIGAEGLEVKDGVHLFLKDTAEEFASAVCQLLDSFEDRESLRCRARKLVEEKYDWEVISKAAAKQMLALQDKIASKKS